MNFKWKKTSSIIAILLGISVFLATARPGQTYTSVLYQECIQGNNTQETVARELPIFNILEVSGAFKINILSNQTEQFVKITGAENILPHIATITSGNKLLIYERKPICSGNGVILDISVGNLDALISSGSDDVKVHELHTDRFSLLLEGAGDIELTGWATRFDANISGSGDLESRGLKTQTTVLNISGAGYLNVHAAKTLKVDIVGSAEVNYTGDPPEVIQDILGIGSLNKI